MRLTPDDEILDVSICDIRVKHEVSSIYEMIRDEI
jgi:hypothetical protein